MDVTIESLGADAVRAREAALVDLLVDCVDGGASVGFLPPLAAAEAARYWRSVTGALADSSRVLLVAGAPGAPAIGTAQLVLAMRANGLHRAEVIRLLVHRRGRRRTTLHLDTREGDADVGLRTSVRFA